MSLLLILSLITQSGIGFGSIPNITIDKPILSVTSQGMASISVQATEYEIVLYADAYAEDEDFKNEARMAYRSMLRTFYPGYDFQTSWPDFEELITVLDEWELYRQDYEGKNIL